MKSSNQLRINISFILYTFNFSFNLCNENILTHVFISWWSITPSPSRSYILNNQEHFSSLVPLEVMWRPIRNSLKSKKPSLFVSKVLKMCWLKFWNVLFQGKASQQSSENWEGPSSPLGQSSMKWWYQLYNFSLVSSAHQQALPLLG